MLPDSIRTDLIFLAESGSVVRDGDCTIISTPDNPTYWWGNTLVFDAPPRTGDFARWTTLFERRIRAHQPESRHTTFGWYGDEEGEVAPFLEAGYTLLESVVTTATPATLQPAPHRDDDAIVRTMARADWDALHALLVETRDDGHSEAGYAEFATRRISSWRALAEPTSGAPRGAWFGAWRDDVNGPQLVSALGVFVEANVAADGRRLGRFQHVVTHPAYRRRGLAGMLVERAARFAFAELDADALVIVAAENDVARRVYASLGFTPSGWQRGLELPGY